MRRVTALVAAAVIIAGSTGFAAFDSAQARQTTPAAKIPRAADGKPDLSGVWITGFLALLVGDKEARAIADADRAAGRVLPPPEQLSYKPEAEAKRQYFLSRRGIDDPMARCYISGVPRITTRPLPFQIFHMKDQVLILYEAHHAFRIIPTDGRKHPDDIEPSFNGDSVGRWEGDTLVVDTIGFNEKTWLAGVGTIHTDKMHVVERFTRDSAETIRYDVTVEDPDVLTRPWHEHEIFHVRQGERLREYECIENNEDLLRFEKLLETDPTLKAK